MFGTSHCTADVDVIPRANATNATNDAALKQICWELQGLEIGIPFNLVIGTEKFTPAAHDSKEYEILLQMNTTNSHQTQLFENQGELHDLFKMISKYAVLLFPYAY